MGGYIEVKCVLCCKRARYPHYAHAFKRELINHNKQLVQPMICCRCVGHEAGMDCFTRKFDVVLLER